MTSKDVRGVIFRELAPRLPGFKANLGESAFVRKIPDGKQALVVGIIDYRPEFRFSLTLTTRLNAVQDIVNQLSRVLPKNYKTTLTTMTQLDWFIPSDRTPKQYSVSIRHDASR